MVLQARDADDVSSVSTIPFKLFMLCIDPSLSLTLNLFFSSIHLYSFANENEIELNREWKKISVQIDDFSRVWIPITYFVILPILFAQAQGS